MGGECPPWVCCERLALVESCEAERSGLHGFQGPPACLPSKQSTPSSARNLAHGAGSQNPLFLGTQPSPPSWPVMPWFWPLKPHIWANLSFLGGRPPGPPQSRDVQPGPGPPSSPAGIPAGGRSGHLIRAGAEIEPQRQLAAARAPGPANPRPPPRGQTLQGHGKFHTQSSSLEGGAARTPGPWERSGFTRCLSTGRGQGEPFGAGEVGPQRPSFHQRGGRLAMIIWV